MTKRIPELAAAVFAASASLVAIAEPPGARFGRRYRVWTTRTPETGFADLRGKKTAAKRSAQEMGLTTRFPADVREGSRTSAEALSAERFSAEWLALREPFDHAARSVALARRLADGLPARRPRLMDIGAGTGSLFRFLAPIVGRGQDWVLVDADAALLDEAFGRTAAWARRRGFAATAQGDELLVSTPRGLWRMRTLCTPRPLAGEGVCQNDAPSPGAARRPLPQAGEVEVDAVLCSALLDLMSARQLSRLCDTLRVPFLACLTVDGRDTWRPRHPHDALVRTAFRRDMRRDKGLGPALGVDAACVLMSRASASAPSDWHIPRTALRMQRALIDGTADAARNARPAFAGAITAWQEARLAQAMAGRLAITIGHRDILAPPPGG